MKRDTRLIVQSNGRLAAVVQGDGQTDRTGNQVATNTTLVSESSSIGVGNRSGAFGDRGASAVGEGTANLHTLNGEIGILGLDSGDVEARPARVGSRAEVKFTPCRSIAAVAVGGDGALGGSPATLGVGIEGVVLGGTGGECEAVAGITIPAVHLAIGTNLVPDHDLPILGVRALELHDILVAAGLGAGDLNDIATIGATNVADVSITRARRVGGSTEAISTVLATGRNRSPIGTGTG